MEEFLSRKVTLLVLIFILSLLLVACSNSDESLSTPILTPEENISSTSTSTALSIPEPQPTDTMAAAASVEEAMSAPSVTAALMEEDAPENRARGAGLAPYQSTHFDIQLGIPEDWLVQEDPELGITIESGEGVFQEMPSVEGAAILILPRNELASEEIVEALRLSVAEYGPAPSIFIEYPTVSQVGDNEVATAAFRIRETGIEGYYVFIQDEGEGVFVFAATTGLAKAYFLGLVESTIDSTNLGDSPES